MNSLCVLLLVVILVVWLIVRRKENFELDLRTEEEAYKTISTPTENFAKEFKGYMGHLMSVNKERILCIIFIINTIKAENIMEIGLHIGHGMFSILNNCPDIKHLLEFDLCAGDTPRSFDKLKRTFPKIDMELICGDSKKTVREHKPKTSYDFIHVDGGHSFADAHSDIINSKKYAHKNTILCVDDSGREFSWIHEDVNDAIKKAIADNIIYPITTGICNKGNTFYHYIIN